MARTGRPLPPLELSADETEELRRLERRRTTAQALAQRARIVLACAEGRSNAEVARTWASPATRSGSGASASSTAAPPDRG